MPGKQLALISCRQHRQGDGHAECDAQRLYRLVEHRSGGSRHGGSVLLAAAGGLRRALGSGSSVGDQPVRERVPRSRERAVQERVRPGAGSLVRLCQRVLYSN